MPNLVITQESIKSLSISEEVAEQVNDECRILAEIIFQQWMDGKVVKQAESGRNNTNLISDIGSERKESCPRPESISEIGHDYGRQRLRS